MDHCSMWYNQIEWLLPFSLLILRFEFRCLYFCLYLIGFSGCLPTPTGVKNPDHVYFFHEVHIFLHTKSACKQISPNVLRMSPNALFSAFFKPFPALTFSILFFILHFLLFTHKTQSIKFFLLRFLHYTISTFPTSPAPAGCQ